MIKTIAKKEFTEQFRDGRFRWTATIILSLFLVASLMGWKSYRDIEEQHSVAQRETRDQWLNQGEKNPHSAAHYAVYAFKPKMPLSFFDRGIDDYTGVSIWLEAHKQNQLAYKPAQDQTAVGRFGELNGAKILQVLLPLLIVLLTFSTFTGERESGTLRQLLSLGVSRKNLFFGKAIGVSGALAFLIIPATFFGVLFLAFNPNIEIASTDFGRILFLIIAYLLYFGIFVSVSLMISALAFSSRAALVLLLGFWILNCLIAPRLTADMAKNLYPTPSAFNFTAKIDHELKNGLDGHNPQNKRQDELKQRILAQYNVNRVEDLPVSFAAIALQESEEYGNKVFDRHYSSLWNSFEKQNRFKQLSGVLAPFLAIQAVSMGLAGTDFAHHRNFSEAAESYRRMLVKTMNDDMKNNAARIDYQYKANNELWSRVEDFHYTAPGIQWVLEKQVLGLLTLLIWFLMSGSAAYWAIGRIKVC